jgi:hypothetical protein
MIVPTLTPLPVGFSAVAPTYSCNRDAGSFSTTATMSRCAASSEASVSCHAAALVSPISARVPCRDFGRDIGEERGARGTMPRLAIVHAPEQLRDLLGFGPRLWRHDSLVRSRVPLKLSRSRKMR